MLRILIAVGSLLFVSSSFAGALSYTCVVTHAYSLSESGELRRSTMESEMKGSSFSVSRISGRIEGQVIPTMDAKSTRVVNNGSADSSFRAIADFETHVQTLEVREFITGPVKPFVSLSKDTGGIVTGTCK